MKFLNALKVIFCLICLRFSFLFWTVPYPSPPAIFHKASKFYVIINVCKSAPLRYKNAQRILYMANSNKIEGELFPCIKQICNNTYTILQHVQPKLDDQTVLLYIEDDAEILSWHGVLDTIENAYDQFSDLDLLSFYMDDKYNTWQSFFLTSRFWHGNNIHRVLPWSGYAYVVFLAITPMGRQKILASNMQKQCINNESLLPDIYLGEMSKKHEINIYRYGGHPLVRHAYRKLGGSLITPGRK